MLAFALRWLAGLGVAVSLYAVVLALGSDSVGVPAAVALGLASFALGYGARRLGRRG